VDYIGPFATSINSKSSVAPLIIGELFDEHLNCVLRFCLPIYAFQDAQGCFQVANNLNQGIGNSLI
jgi:hypothetical protein